MVDEVSELPPLRAATLITTREQVSALGSSMRMRLLAVCKQPRSVREMAERLRVPKTTLYYHVNILEDAGFIEVVRVRKSGARLERIYRVTGKVIEHEADLGDRLGDPAGVARAMVAVVVEPTRLEAEAALAGRFEGSDQVFYMGRDEAMLTDADAEEIRSRLAEFARQMFTDRDAGEGPDARPYAFTYTLTRTDPR